jgi:asparagine synthase (glutamine-hydrolysing)
VGEGDLLERSEAIAARDPIGIIPLYYGHGRDGAVWFSSEMKGLQDNCATFQALPPGLCPSLLWLCGREQGQTTLRPYWSFVTYAPCPEASADCPSIAIGHIYNSKTHAVECWYSDPWQNIDFVPTRKITLQELRAAFEAAVVRHMMAETPCGVLLSGGLDSSLVAAIAARYQSPPGRPLQKPD